MWKALTVALMLTTTAACADDAGWMRDFDAAKQKAKETNRPILADFSGSDWCGWCIKLDKEVFSQDAFKEYAKENLVLLLLDFPRRTELPKAEAEQNQKLSEEYGIRGFPTVLVLDAEGKELARTGYQRGGAETYVKHLSELVKKSD
jgi:thioredoxin-related protein